MGLQPSDQGPVHEEYRDASGFYIGDTCGCTGIM